MSETLFENEIKRGEAFQKLSSTMELNLIKRSIKRQFYLQCSICEAKRVRANFARDFSRSVKVVLSLNLHICVLVNIYCADVV